MNPQTQTHALPASEEVEPNKSRARDIQNKKDNTGDVLPTAPEGVEFRLAKERINKEATPDPEDAPLTFQEETFIRTYFANGFNHRDAAQRARIPYNSIALTIRKPHVRRAMEEIQAEASKELKISQHKIVADLYEMYTCTLSDLVEHRRGACRYCWGKNGLYHWRTKRERAEHKAKYPKDSPKRLSWGGTGYSEYAAPNPDCAECSGHGISVVIVKDTMGMKGAATLDYSPTGRITIKGYDKTRIAEMLLKHLGAIHPYTNEVKSGPTINIHGGIPPEFMAALKERGGLAALEAFINSEGDTRVAQLEAQASAEEELEIQAMMANGEQND